ncbi:NUDIX domain-containing protein [Candidatus Woesearchaeota archaeon]|nr:NUDIX domain-containing protein [Candidatus Woesearchaeota archaeon]
MAVKKVIVGKMGLSERNYATREVVRGIPLDIDRGEVILFLTGKQDMTSYWGFPGGGIEDGESELGALERELVEELGIRSADFELYGHISHEPDSFVVQRAGKSTLINSVFYPFIVGGGAEFRLNRSSDNHLAYVRMPIFEAGESITYEEQRESFESIVTQLSHDFLNPERKVVPINSGVVVLPGVIGNYINLSPQP